MKKLKIDISFFGILSLVILFLLNGKYAFGNMMFCAFVHELGHFCALAICKVKPEVISLGFLNFNIKYNKLKTTYKADIFISSAGIIFNLFLSVIAFSIGNKDVAFTSIVLAIINLLPLRGLDGGNILHGLLSLSGDKELNFKKTQKINDAGIMLYRKVFTPVFLCVVAILTDFNVSVTFSGALLLMSEYI